MRVAVIHNLRLGGAHRRMREQVSRLRGDVVEVCLGTATPVTPDPHVVSLVQRASGVTRAARAPFRYVDLAALLGAWRAAATVVEELEVDVVYANPCQYLQAPGGLLRGRLPALYFCDEPRRVDHDPSAMGSRNGLTRPLYAPIYRTERARDRRAVARAAALATNSRFTAQEIRRAYGREAEVVPMGVSDVFREVAPSTPGHILSVGTLIPAKGHDIALAGAAAARRRRPMIVVAPRDDEREAGRLREAARRAGVELEIRVGIPDRDLAELYASAQALVYMARREPFGLAALEAQASGCPAIVADEGGLPEAILPGRTGWAVPCTAAAVAEKLDELERSDVRAAFSTAARAHAAGAGWEQSARAIEAILERLRAERRCAS